MLTLAVHPSFWLKRSTWVLSALAAIALLLAALPLWLQGLGLVVLLLANLRGNGGGALQLQCQADGSLSIQQTGEDWRPVTLLPGSMVNPWLTTIRYRGESGNKVGTLVLLPDSLDREDFRRLRVWLKWKAALQSSAE